MEPEKFARQSQKKWEQKERKRKRHIFMMDGARARRTPEGNRQKLRKLYRRQGARFKK